MGYSCWHKLQWIPDIQVLMLDNMWLAVILGVAGFIWMLRRWMKDSRLPPGPRGWPLVGNAFQQDREHRHITWSEWVNKYGEVLTISNFGTKIVLCSSSDSLWELLVSKSADFAGRPHLPPFTYLTGGTENLGSDDFNSHYVYKKKVFMNSLKMYGEGLKRLETIMEDVIRELVDDFQKSNQQPFDPYRPFQLALCNTLALLLLGDRFEYSDPDFVDLLYYIAYFENAIKPSLEFFLTVTFPWLLYLPLPYCKVLDKFANGFMKDWLPRMIKKRMIHYDRGNPRCVLDAFIKQHESDMETHPQDVLEMRHVLVLCQNMFTAGMLTSTSMMYTMLAILTNKTKIQDKVQAEIDQVLGERRPKIEDKKSMPYFQAVFEEVLRYAVIANGLPHKATVDSSICGHFIPKDTQVWPNVWHLCHDPSIWEEPWEFKPERFLDDNGDFLPPDHPARRNVLIFGAGRRICPGEQLARNRIFLLMTSLLQTFRIVPAADDQLPQFDPRTYPSGLVIKPGPYKIRAIPRD